MCHVSTVDSGPVQSLPTSSSAASGSERAQALAGAAGLDVEQVAAHEVDVPVFERGKAGDVLVLDVEALGAELGDGGVQVAGVPQRDGVEDQTEGCELVLLALAVRLADLAPAAVADRAGEPVAGLPHGELPVHQPPVGVVDRVDHGEQVHGLVDPPVLGERRPQRGRVALAAEHPQQVVGPDLVGDQRSGDPEHVRPVRLDTPQVDLVAGHRLQRPVPVRRRLAVAVGQVGPPEPLIGQVAEARGEAEAEHLVQAEGHVGVYGDSSS